MSSLTRDLALEFLAWWEIVWNILSVSATSNLSEY
jgi:hypothetical protein